MSTNASSPYPLSAQVYDLELETQRVARDLHHEKDRNESLARRLRDAQSALERSETAKKDSPLVQNLRWALSSEQERVRSLEKNLLAAQEQIKAHSEKARAVQVSLDVEKNKTRVLGTLLAESVSKETWTYAATLDV